MAEALLIPQFEQDLSDYALKSYVDTAVANKDVGVTTFNGRKGAVSPQSGDYTYSMVGAASSGHGHSGTYADYSHTHNYAAASHTHSYAASNHTHDYAASNHTHTITGSSHTHSDYASSSHTHSTYASSSHTHSGYASSTHTHSYASSSHTHSGYASSSHTHSASDISGLVSGGLGQVYVYDSVNSLTTTTITLSSAAKGLMCIHASGVTNNGTASKYYNMTVTYARPGGGYVASFSSNGKTITVRPETIGSSGTGNEKFMLIFPVYF